MVKKILVLFTVIVLSVGMVACKAATATKSEKKATTKKSTSKKKTTTTKKKTYSTAKSIKKDDPRVAKKKTKITVYAYAKAPKQKQAEMIVKMDLKILLAFQIQARGFAYKKVGNSVSFSSINQNVDTSGLQRPEIKAVKAGDMWEALAAVPGEFNVDVPATKDVIVKKVSDNVLKIDRGVNDLMSKAIKEAAAEKYPDKKDISVKGIIFISDLLVEKDGDKLKMSATFSVAFDE